MPIGSFPATLTHMMARASRSIPTYTPSLYLPGSFGRYRQYPRVVRTSIPGAGVEAGKMVWGEQVMNLWGAPVAKYSNARVPLLGLGQMSMPTSSDLMRIGGGFLAGALAMHLAHKYRWLGMR